MEKRVTSALLCLVFTTMVSAQGPQVGVDIRAKEAAQVVVATVIDITSRYGVNAHGDQLIYSDVVAEVSETLKGAPTNIVIVTVEGGEVGDVALHVSDMPVVNKGERILYFLDHTADGRWVPHRRALGIVKVDSAERLDRGQMTLGQARTQIRSALTGK